MARKSEWQPAYVSVSVTLLHDSEFLTLSGHARMLWYYLRAEYRPNKKKYKNSETGRIHVPSPYVELQKKSGFKAKATISKAFRELLDNEWIGISVQGGLHGGMSWYFFDGEYSEFLNKKRGQKKRKRKKQRFIKVVIEMLNSSAFQELSIASQDLYILLEGEYNPNDERCRNIATGRKQVYFPYKEIQKIEGFRSRATISKSFRDLIDKNWIEKSEKGGLYGGKSAYSFKDDNLGFQTGERAIKGIGDKYLRKEDERKQDNFRKNLPRSVTGITNPRHQMGSS